MADEKYTSEGLPVIINPKNIADAIIFDVERSRDKEFKEFFNDLWERIKKENRGYIAAIKQIMAQQYGQALEGDQVEHATTGFIFGYEILRKQAEANQLERKIQDNK